MTSWNHLFDGEAAGGSRTHRARIRRGFSMTELTLALGVLALFVTIVTLAVVRGQLTANTQKSDRIVVAALDRLVERAAVLPFEQVSDGSFTRPESTECEDPSLSCPVVLGRMLNVRWVTETGGDLDDIVETVDWVDLRAEVDWNGATFTSSRRVAAPTPNWRQGWGSLRVSVSGAVEGATQLYLVDASTGRPAAAAAAVNDGVAWLSAPVDVCGRTTDGCSLALGPYGATTDTDVALDAVAALTTLTIHETRLTETSALLRPIGDLSLLLYATNGAGETDSASRAGSICLWASFHDGVAARQVPFCNDEQPDRILFDTYRPDQTRAWVQLPLPVGVPLTLTTDDPSGGCAQPTGTVRWDGSAWVDGGTCTSWTWGTPATITGTLLSEDFEGVSIRLVEGSQRLEVSWTTTAGLPAAGGSSLQALWAHPRDADLRLQGESCPPSTPHCRSGALVAPVLTSPRVGDAKVTSVAASSGTADFTLTATDFDYNGEGGPVSISVSAVDLGGGSLVRLDTEVVDGVPLVVETPLSSGDNVVVGSNGTATSSLRVNGVASGYRSVSFTLSGDGGSRSVSVAVTTSPLPAKLFTEPTRVDQGGSGSIRVRVFDTNGQPSVGTTVTAAGVPAGMSVGTGVTGVDGWVALPVTVTTATAGNRNVALETNGVDGVGRIRVMARAGSVSLAPSVPDPVVVDQGSTTTFEFTVRDLAGDILPQTAAAVWATAGGGDRSGDVYSTARGCETDLVGRCEVSVAATPQAPTGSYQLNVKVHGVSATVALRVDPTPLRVGAPLVTLKQSDTSELVVTVLDGSGQPVAGVSVSANTSVPGLIVTGATTDNSGVARLPVSTSASTTAGLHSVSLTAGEATGSSSIRVRQKVAQLVTTAVTLPQGGAARTNVTALDASGSVVPGVVVSAVSADGLVLRAAPSNAEGIIALGVEAPVTMVATAYLVSLSVEGVLLEMLPVRVQRGVGSVTASGSVSPGTSSTITIRLFDLDGQNIASRSLSVATTNSSLQLGTTVAVTPPSNEPVSFTTGPDGSVEVPAYLSSAATNGPIGLRVTTGGRSFAVYVQVST